MKDIRVFVLLFFEHFCRFESFQNKIFKNWKNKKFMPKNNNNLKRSHQAGYTWLMSSTWWVAHDWWVAQSVVWGLHINLFISYTLGGVIPQPMALLLVAFLNSPLCFLFCFVSFLSQFQIARGLPKKYLFNFRIWSKNDSHCLSWP